MKMTQNWRQPKIEDDLIVDDLKFKDDLKKEKPNWFEFQK